MSTLISKDTSDVSVPSNNSQIGIIDHYSNFFYSEYEKIKPKIEKKIPKEFETQSIDQKLPIIAKIIGSKLKEISPFIYIESQLSEINLRDKSLTNTIFKWGSSISTNEYKFPIESERIKSFINEYLKRIEKFGKTLNDQNCDEIEYLIKLCLKNGDSHSFFSLCTIFNFLHSSKIKSEKLKSEKPLITSLIEKKEDAEYRIANKVRSHKNEIIFSLSQVTDKCMKSESVTSVQSYFDKKSPIIDSLKNMQTYVEISKESEGVYKDLICKIVILYSKYCKHLSNEENSSSIMREILQVYTGLSGVDQLAEDLIRRLENEGNSDRFAVYSVLLKDFKNSNEIKIEILNKCIISVKDIANNETPDNNIRKIIYYILEDHTGFGLQTKAIDLLLQYSDNESDRIYEMIDGKKFKSSEYFHLFRYLLTKQSFKFEKLKSNLFDQSQHEEIIDSILMHVEENHDFDLKQIVDFVCKEIIYRKNHTEKEYNLITKIVSFISFNNDKLVDEESIIKLLQINPEYEAHLIDKIKFSMAFSNEQLVKIFKIINNNSDILPWLLNELIDNQSLNLLDNSILFNDIHIIKMKNLINTVNSSDNISPTEIIKITTTIIEATNSQFQNEDKREPFFNSLISKIIEMSTKWNSEESVLMAIKLLEKMDRENLLFDDYIRMTLNHKQTSVEISEQVLLTNADSISELTITKYISSLNEDSKRRKILYFILQNSIIVERLSDETFEKILVEIFETKSDHNLLISQYEQINDD